MVENHYRWDFIGLSTDSKPTADNPKVTDGSTFYESNTSKLFVWCNDRWYEKEGGGELPIASADTLGGIKVGSNLSINSETGALSGNYSAFTGTDGTSAGSAGLVPAPATTDAGKFLKADGTWGEAGGGDTGVTVLTTSDYNYPTDNPTGVALWLMPEGIFKKSNKDVVVYVDKAISSTYDDAGKFRAEANDCMYYYTFTSTIDASRLYIQALGQGGGSFGDFNNASVAGIIKKSDGTYYSTQPDGQILSIQSLVNALNSTSTKRPLTAYQGKVLNDKFGGVSIVKISQTDYNNLGTKDADTLYFIY